MNIILAQLKKDLHCQRRPMIAWGICALASLVPVVLLGLFSHLPHFNLEHPGAVMVGILSIGGIAVACVVAAGAGQFLLLPLMVVRIVQEDPLLGTTAFWRTRPIPREKMLAAKALLILALPLPLLFLGGAEARFGAGHFWAAELAWLAAFAAVASITAGAKEFLIYAVALLFGKGVWGTILAQLWMRINGDSLSLVREAQAPLAWGLNALHLNGTDFYHCGYFAGFAAVFAHQYLTLRTRTSLALLVGVVVVMGLLQMLGGLPSDLPGTP